MTRAGMVLLAMLAARVAAAEPVPDQEVERPFSFLVDPHGPGSRQVLVGYSLAGGSSAGALRPVPGNLDARGVVHALALEAGVVRRLAVYADVLLSQPLDQGRTAGVAARAGLRVLLTPPSLRRLRVTADVGYLHEFGAADGLLAEVTGAVDVGRVRFAATAHLERVFGGARDPIDLYAVAALSVRVAGPLRLGAEYVAQDLEAAFADDEAEGGARHYLGPDLALRLAGGRVLVSAGLVVEAARAPGVLGRGGLSYWF